MGTRKFDLIILGPQGSGKGTQAKLLSEKFGHVHLSSGDLLREVARQDTALGRKIHQLVNVEGKLVEDELIADIFKDKLANLPKDKPVILDGFPRTAKQYEIMKQFWPMLERGDYRAIAIELSENEAVKRLGSRLTCEACSTPYIASQAPPRCAKCGGKLIQRPDDREDAIRKRLETYKDQTRPLVGIFEQEGKLMRIDGSPSVEKVQEEILTKL